MESYLIRLVRTDLGVELGYGSFGGSLVTPKNMRKS